MKSILLILIVAANLTLTYADSSVKYSRIRIFVPDRSSLVRILDSGIDYEGASGKVGGWMEFIAGSPDLQRLSERNISYTIVTDDLQKEDLKHLHRGPLNALGFGSGSMGGYYTYTEVLQQLDSMAIQFPNLITPRQSIGMTSEGRGLWIAKISNNPYAYDSSKPEVLFTALHHAREPEGMMTVIYYMWWLLENYGTDPDATYLLNNRQIWFLPVFNPDGYVYNQTINPSGGGYWRKNRRINGDGSFGVDLNRNYGPTEMWDSPYGGSDVTTWSDVYRGPAPFSEPETSNLRYWLMWHNVKTCLNYHTFGDDYVYPWGYLPWESPDSITFREYCFDMTGFNRYVSGVDMQTVGYVTRGNSDDFMYGDSSKPQAFAMTPEVGPSFWPSSDLILPLAVENLEPNKYFSYVAGQYTVTKRFDLADQNGNGGIEKGENFTLAVTLRNKGLGEEGKIHALISTTNPDIVWTTDHDSLNAIPARSEAQVSFKGQFSALSTHGGAIQFVVTLTDDNGYLHYDTLSTYLGTPLTLFEDHGDSGTARWSTGVTWGVTTNAHSSPNAFTDSPNGSYTANTDNSLTLLQPVGLGGFDHAVLSYWTQWQIEPRYDFATAEISSDGGSTWSTLRSALSHIGSGQGVQTANTWGFDGYTPRMEWVEQQADLAGYVGDSILIRFRVRSDPGSERDGFYVDDIRLVGYKGSVIGGVVEVTVHQQWNLVSVPVASNDTRRETLFPGSTSPAFGFDSSAGYLQFDTLVKGKGYWLRFPALATQYMAGQPISAETISVNKGWNLIGSLSNPIRCSSILSDMPGIVTSGFFGYFDGYAQVDTIQPGRGYWVKVNQSCEIILSDGLMQPTGANAGRIRIVPTDELPPPPPDARRTTDNLPREYGVDQGYPNPFNPSTTIRYQLPVESQVALNIYNLLGQLVAVIVDRVEQPGYKQIQWNGTNFASGIYFCRLDATSTTAHHVSFHHVNKMVLMK